jgi:hypothetical protein
MVVIAARLNPLTYLVGGLRGSMVEHGRRVFGLGLDCGVPFALLPGRFDLVPGAAVPRGTVQ